MTPIALPEGAKYQSCSPLSLLFGPATKPSNDITISTKTVPMSYLISSLVLLISTLVRISKGEPSGIEGAHPMLPCVDRVRHDLIQGGEVIAKLGLTVFSRRGRLRAKQCLVGLLADADVQAKNRWATQVGGLVIGIVGHQRGEWKLALR